MNKTIRLIQNYLLFTLPLVVMCMIWGEFSPETNHESYSTLQKVIWEILSYNLMFWFAVLILFLFILVFNKQSREMTLTRLTNIKERDEREEVITEKASKMTYISSLSILILFLFLSVFTINIHRVPQDQAINGKTGSVSIGLHFNFFDSPQVKTNTKGEIIFESKDIPLSKSAILLVLIAWQLMTFNLAARKESLI